MKNTLRLRLLIFCLVPSLVPRLGLADTTTPLVATGTGCSGGTDATDQAGQGNCSAKDLIKSSSARLANLKVSNASDITAAEAKYEKSWKSCVDAQKAAATSCKENMSPNLASAMAAVAGIAASMMGGGANGSCSGFGSAMNNANQGLNGYSSSCTNNKNACTSGCGSGVEALDSLKSAANAATCGSGDTACLAGLAAAKQALASSLAQEKDTSDKTSVAGKNQLCGGDYANSLASAAMGIASTLAGMLQGNQCAQDTAAATTPTTAVNCLDPAQALTPTCLCEANPRLTGCSNGLQKMSDVGRSDEMTGVTATGAGVNSGAPTLKAADNSITPGALPGDTGGASPGGGSPGSPLGGASNLAAQGKEKEGGGGAGSNLNTSILSGFSSGGGGGGSRFPASKEDYRAFLPGGAKDPNKIDGSALLQQISGEGGKSNWEKVRQRYFENHASFLIKEK